MTVAEQVAAGEAWRPPRPPELAGRSQRRLRTLLGAAEQDDEHPGEQDQ